MDGRSYLADIFDLAFGVKSPVFIPYAPNLDKLIFKENDPYKLPEGQLEADPLYQDIRVKTAVESKELSWMGTPVVYPFWFKRGNYKVYSSNGELQNYMLSDFMMPAATLIDFSRAKNIVKTPVLGSNGTVKELYSFDDWKIRVRGVCLDDDRRKSAKTAVEQKEELLKWERVCSSVEVVGSLFNEKNISVITINSISFTQLEGKPGIIPFEMECESDEDLVLI